MNSNPDEVSKRIKESIPSVDEDKYGQKYRDHILEQYKIYLGMADKISDRRALANTFFLTINTGLVTAAGVSNLRDVGKDTHIEPFFMLIVSLAAILFCYVWYRLIRSYKDMNSAKFKVVHVIEEHLPLKLFDAEWEGVGRGENKKLYLPFTHVEIYIPFIFILIYASLLIYSLVKMC